MTYQTQEISNQDGRPVSFYEIVWGNTVWRYTSADRDLTIGADTYTAVPISDSGMVQGGSSNNDLTVELPASLPLVALFDSTPPSDEIKLTVRRRHYGDTQAFVYWVGYVANVKRKEDDVGATVLGNTLLSTFKRSGLRLAWTRGCPHVLYDDECRVDPADFAMTAEITALTGNSITIDAFTWPGVVGDPEQWFVGGYIEWEANVDGTLDRRAIKSSVSLLEYVLLGTTHRLEVGMAVTLYPGCNLTTGTCKTKFDNLANYGGCEQMSGKNPFTEEPIL